MCWGLCLNQSWQVSNTFIWEKDTDFHSITDTLSVPFLASSGLIDFGVSAKFNPREGALEPRGLEISLRMGDCSAKVDLLNMLLRKAFPKKTQAVRPIPPPLVPPSLVSPTTSYGDNTSLGSSFAWGSQKISALPSPPQSAQSFTSSLFSPMSMFSPRNSVLSPNSTNMLSPSFPRSPSSPFFKAISVKKIPQEVFNDG